MTLYLPTDPTSFHWSSVEQFGMALGGIDGMWANIY